MPYDSDVIVVGSGAGGATLAYACAKAGQRVLLVERGREHILEKPDHDEQAMLIDKKPYDDRKIEVNGAEKRLYMGGSLGGGTALFARPCCGPAVTTSIPASTTATAFSERFGIGRLPTTTWLRIMPRPRRSMAWREIGTRISARCKNPTVPSLISRCPCTASIKN